VARATGCPCSEGTKGEFINLEYFPSGDPLLRYAHWQYLPVLPIPLYLRIDLNQRMNAGGDSHTALAGLVESTENDSFQASSISVSLSTIHAALPPGSRVTFFFLPSLPGQPLHRCICRLLQDPCWESLVCWPDNKDIFFQHEVSLHELSE